MNHSEYPALFKSADHASNEKQRMYLRLIKVEYWLLIIASVLTMAWFDKEFSAVSVAIIFMATLAILITRTFMKPEQDWYKCRALAESVKTLTWRYMMHAEPFNDPSISVATTRFLTDLQTIFNDNKTVAEKACNQWSGDDQVTTGMREIRNRSLTERKKFYLESRIGEQHKWYTDKALYNKKTGYKWAFVGAMSYCIAMVLTILRVAHSEWFWPIEPFIVAGAAVLGWMQIKKYNELSATYNLTAHEIGLLKSRLVPATTEKELSDRINDSEFAFSREHTLWLARKTI